MRIQTTTVDLSGLPYWPYYVIATSRIHRTVDPNIDLRMILGEAVPPVTVKIFGLGNGRLLLAAIKERGG